jgi:Domain of unknown function (DUF3597)
MSIFGSIMSGIFGHASAAPTATGAKTPAAPQTTQSAPAATPASGAKSPGAPKATAQSAPASAQGGSPAATQSGPVAGAPIDVAAIMDKLASQTKEKLDWRRSIVDLMKLLDLDSSLTARKQLAQELHYSGDTSDSAAMNVWLHKQVMTKLAENGGKVPDELRHSA